ncbi:hypothetical protein Syun_016663 [Stephania yunnanensis]|uniref:Uncharacterized protein n=1 Tax=Stephania yunnanensis TaxID=152371 RepID=A0AAP0J5B8_9MAGN
MIGRSEAFGPSSDMTLWSFARLVNAMLSDPQCWGKDKLCKAERSRPTRVWVVSGPEADMGGEPRVDRWGIGVEIGGGLGRERWVGTRCRDGWGTRVNMGGGLKVKMRGGPEAETGGGLSDWGTEVGA